VALRIPVFIALRGYDESFHYYAEEYDLAARMIRAGYRVAFEPAFRVEHAKAAAGRDTGTILSRLVRNNGWVIQRYAPEGVRRAALRQSRRRYRAIARQEGATPGFAAGLSELRRTVGGQPRRGMSPQQWDRFTGLAAAREALRAELALRPFRTAALIDRGKNDAVVAAALAELGVRIVEDAASAEARVIGSMSPGPMLDAFERRRGEAGPPVVAPWLAARAAAPRRAA
jgi:hypothetical protein